MIKVIQGECFSPERAGFVLSNPHSLFSDLNTLIPQLKTMKLLYR